MVHEKLSHLDYEDLDQLDPEELGHLDHEELGLQDLLGHLDPARVVDSSVQRALVELFACSSAVVAELVACSSAVVAELAARSSAVVAELAARSFAAAVDASCVDAARLGPVVVFGPSGGGIKLRSLHRALAIS